MKNCSHLALLVFGLLAQSAYAQNAVTLYGIIDTSIDFIHNDGGKNAALMSGGNLQGSRWGLKGSEDLGGGTTTIFKLENGFSSANGTLGGGGRIFGRQAYVGIANEKWGTVTLGRQYVPDSDFVQAITGDNYGSVFATPGDIDNYDNSVRANNSIKYVSPVFGGLQADLLYGFGNQPGSVANGNGWGVALSYLVGPVALAASYQYYNGGDPTPGTQRNYQGSADSIFGSIVNEGYSSSKSIKIARVAGQYTAGSFVTGLTFSNSQYVPDAASTFSTTQKYNSAAIFTSFRFTPALNVAIGYSFTTTSGDTSARYNQFSSAIDYNISKRTDIYFVGAWQHASGSVRGEDGVGVISAQASFGSYGVDGAGQAAQEFAAVGIRHKF